MLRLFVGLSLPQGVRDHLATLTGGIPGARWVQADAYHITLFFAGEVPEPVAADLDEQLVRLTAPGFDLSIRGVGHFGTRRKPSSLWAGVDRAPPLAFLRNKVERAAVAAGFEPEDRKFAPHITLARLRQAPMARVQTWLAHHDALRLPPIPIAAFTLFRSHLGSERAQYEALADYPLAPPAG